jgi:ATP-dependent DNA helicase RecQ
MDLRQALQQHFGHDSFRSGQEDVIRALLEGRSALALFPTGAGKSLCYQLPALLMDGVTLVVSPLIALMKDQVEALRSRGIEAARLDSSISSDEYSNVMKSLVGGRLKLLYVAPERLTSEVFVTQLKRARIAMMAEAPDQDRAGTHGHGHQGGGEGDPRSVPHPPIGSHPDLVPSTESPLPRDALP